MSQYWIGVIILFTFLFILPMSFASWYLFSKKGKELYKRDMINQLARDRKKLEELEKIWLNKE